MENPFALVPYVSKEYFCDREEETKTIVEDLVNGSNITLISPRRYGKTGLIYRIFDEIEQQKVDVNTCYVDIYATLSRRMSALYMAAATVLWAVSIKWIRLV